MTSNLKNQSPFVITIAVLAVTAFIMVMPVEALFGKIPNDDFKLEYLSLTFKMGLIFPIAYSLIKSLKLQSLAGLSRPFPWRFGYLNLIPGYLIAIALLGLLGKDLSAIAPFNLMLLLIGCLIVGFAEEYLFRGLLQSLFLNKYGLRKNGILISILLSSILFGLFHLLNLTRNDNVGQVLIQVVFATFIGFFFGVMVLKTNRLNPLAITHGLINFSFSIAFLPGLKTVQEEVSGPVSLAPIILTLPLFIIAFLIFKKTDKKGIAKKLEMAKPETHAIRAERKWL
ncbi:CPBP family intramembrane metalloprotease [Aequorivita sp. F47161]|uniref:CPBP family intramembrane metalloprotease n=1 Tax=Aequorivita vitellina TaxID=2874475 RepID=A0A9X1QVC1_9FLAO|nr:CPBP family intramembrane glutamic endopeptidase [Aequorivita vitellina]MCG2417808.1 CPBP family intramembrane metalloprotease [Aequorivita vitellina]